MRPLFVFLTTYCLVVVSADRLLREQEQFVKADLPNTLESALSSRCYADLTEGVFAFMRKAIEVCVCVCLQL